MAEIVWSFQTEAEQIAGHLSRTMKSCVTRGLAIAVLAVLGWAQAAPPAELEAHTNAVPAAQAAEEKAACIQNLKTIYSAIEAYQLDHKDLPNWLSDLVPKYLPDANVLTCPVCRRTGQAEQGRLGDPKIPSSYLFEFCPVPLGAAATNAPNRTRREWKRRQMGLVGSAVPILRCRHHTPLLNVAFDGRIYESPGSWELTVTNRVASADLAADHLFPREPAPSAKGKAPAKRFAARDPKTPEPLLDLTRFYNAMLTESWHGRTNNTLAAVPRGLQSFEGVQFDVRGIVQLGSKSDSAAKYPAQVTGIKVGRKVQHLHFLHAAGFGSTADEGQPIGTYVVHFASQNMRLEIPIRYGHEVRNWHTLPGETPAPADLKIAWKGENPVTKQAGSSIRLFLTTWTNVVPSVPIESIDFVSRMGTAAPFLIAISTD
jgi:hypothetical protein